MDFITVLCLSPALLSIIEIEERAVLVNRFYEGFVIIVEKYAHTQSHNSIKTKSLKIALELQSSTVQLSLISKKKKINFTNYEKKG